MEEMVPHMRVDPSEEMSPARKACDRAFAAACRYSGGRNLVEEIIASNYWPLGKDNPAFQLEKVKVPVWDSFPLLWPVFRGGGNGGQLRCRH